MSPRLFLSPRVLLPALLLQTAFLTAPLQAETLKERQAQVMNVVQKVSPTVVCITGSSIKGSMGSGSGVIVSKDGLILTAGHVIQATGDELTITLPGGREVKAKALGRDMNRDAALAQITEPGEYAFADMGDPSTIEKGEWVLALGHPGGYDGQRGAPLRVGRLWDIDKKSFYRSDCTVSGGDSGGPLFDLEGKVIGIHSSISQDLSENRHVPIAVFEKDMARMKKGEVWGKLSNLMPGMKDDEEGTPENQGNADRPRDRAKPRSRAETPAEPEKASPAGNAWLGATLKTLSDGGVLVEEIVDGSPADQSGLKLEDIIIGVDGKKVVSNDDLVTRIQASKAGDTLKLKVNRKGAEKELDVTLAARP